MLFVQADSARAQENDFSIGNEHFDPGKRGEGISGFMRLRNEADFLPQVIESHLPFLDELVIVHQESTDQTREIVEDYAARFPEKVKSFYYPFDVGPQGSDKHIRCSPFSPESLVYYYEFALSRTTFQHVVKVDGDHIAIPSAFRALREIVLTQNPKVFLSFSGINLWDQDGQIFVPKDYAMSGLHGDIGIFPVGLHTRFHHHRQYERLSHGLPNVSFGPAFFHLKYMKRDRGAGNYRIDENPNSPYRDAKKYQSGLVPPLLEWDEFVGQTELPGYVKHPVELGIQPLARESA